MIRGLLRGFARYPGPRAVLPYPKGVASERFYKHWEEIMMRQNWQTEKVDWLNEEQWKAEWDEGEAL